MTRLKFLPLVSLAALVFFLWSGCQQHATKNGKFYAADRNWSAAGGNAGATKYSLLDQINRNNVHQLRVAWVYRSGNKSGSVQMNPLIVNGRMYITTYAAELIALDAATGRELWRFNPSRNKESLGGVNRGIAYWRNGDDERILYTSGSFLNAVNAATGEPVFTFCDKGRLNLNEGLIRPAHEMQITAPGYPVVYMDMVITGGVSWSAPANVSAFDVATGERRWTFHLIPQPGEFGYDSWGDTSFYRTGAGVNAWGGMALDPDNGIVYISTGQPKDDFFRPENRGAQLYGNCVIALNALTGERLWHYQVIHHDLWDLDLPCAPVLVDLYNGNERIPGLVQLTKTGNIFLFNRLTGELYSKVEERSVSSSGLQGEYAYPTQPYVSWPEAFSKQVVREDDLTLLDSASHAAALRVFRDSDAGWFVPPSEKGILYYGIHGGAEWGGGSYDPDLNRLHVNANEVAWHIRMQRTNKSEPGSSTHTGKIVYLNSGCANCHGPSLKGVESAPGLSALNKKYTSGQIATVIREGKKAMPAFPSMKKEDLKELTRFLLGQQSLSKHKVDSSVFSYRSFGYDKFLDANGYPATRPPWGTLNSINLKTGKIEWKVPLGEYEELTRKGHPVTGTENFGGSITTRGGLIFIAATRDEKIRAFDKATGKILWQHRLPYGGYATPSTYAINNKQYVVIAATGGGKPGTKTGDAYIAFALP